MNITICNSGIWTWDLQHSSLLQQPPVLHDNTVSWGANTYLSVAQSEANDWLYL